MPDRLPDEAAVRFLIAECRKGPAAVPTNSCCGETDPVGDPPESSQISVLARELGAKVNEAVQQSVDLEILDPKGCLQIDRLIARGVLDSDGQVTRDIFGRRVPCQP